MDATAGRRTVKAEAHVQKARRILIVDDDATMRQILETLLSEEGCATSTASSAEQGLSLLRSSPVDIALVDVVLPGMNGLEFLKQAKRNHPDMEVVMMSSHASVERSLEALRNGAYDFLVKPFDELEQVWFTVQRALERKHLAENNRTLVAELKQHNASITAAVERLTCLIDAGRALSSIHSIDELLTYFINLVSQHLKVDRVSLMLLDEAKQELYIAASKGLAADIVKTARVKVGEGIAGHVAMTGKPLLMKNVQSKLLNNDTRPGLSDSFISSPLVLGIPIKFRDRIVGVLNVTNKRSGESFNDSDQAFLSGLAGQAAVAIEAARSFEELRQTCESLTSAKNQLVSSERLNALAQMSAGVAHDFNNILSGILGKVQLMDLQLAENGCNSGSIRSDLAALEQIAMHGAERVKQIMGFAGSRRDHPNAAVDINEIVRAAVSISRPKWKHECERKGASVKIDMALGDISPVEGNPHELTQVVTNLIFNAVEAMMPDGGNLVLRTAQEREHILLEVADTGAGIPAEVRDRIFEPFFTTKETGHGLGMSIVYGIIKRHCGDISVQSEVGQGTVFRILLPAAPAPAPAKQPVKTVQVQQSLSGRVLIIEDDVYNRDLFMNALTLFGHRAVAAAGGAEGLELFRKEPFDVVVTDLSMPGMNGFDVAKEIKKCAPSVPVILMSGAVLQGLETSMKDAGIDFLLPKPFTLDDLNRMVVTGLQPPA
jgi:signal transduction histidine kinase/DNA-binding response OmpR family regulator